MKLPDVETTYKTYGIKSDCIINIGKESNNDIVSECKNFEEIMERGTPYILFYHQE